MSSCGRNGKRWAARSTRSLKSTLADAANDRGKVTRAPCRNASGSSGTSPTIRIAAVLTRCITLMDAATATDMAARATRIALDRQVFDRYAALADAEIRMLAVDDKWLAGIRDAIDGEVRR